MAAAACATAAGFRSISPAGSTSSGDCSSTATARTCSACTFPRPGRSHRRHATSPSRAPSKFFDTHDAVCTSWLLDPQLADHLSAELEHRALPAPLRARRRGGRGRRRRAPLRLCRPSTRISTVCHSARRSSAPSSRTCAPAVTGAARPDAYRCNLASWRPCSSTGKPSPPGCARKSRRRSPSSTTSASRPSSSATTPPRTSTST